MNLSSYSCDYLWYSNLPWKSQGTGGVTVTTFFGYSDMGQRITTACKKISVAHVYFSHDCFRSKSAVQQHVQNLEER